MKTVLSLFLILTLAGMAFGSGESEIAKEITVLMNAPDAPIEVAASARFHADFPDVKITALQVDRSDGSTLTMDAQLAAGTPPNIYRDFIGRVSKYYVPEYALDLAPHIRDLDQYNPGVLEPFKRDGMLMGLPAAGGVQAFGINLDITDAVGFEVRDDWTIDEFMDLAERVKQFYDGEKYVTALFAGNQSGDYLINNWFAAFGVRYYDPGDYSRTTIAETGGAKVYEFFQTLVRNGYVKDGAAMFTDDDYVLHWAGGEIAGGAYFPSWEPAYFQALMDQGRIEGPFRHKYVPFPRGPGVDSVPTYSSYEAFVVHRTDTEADVWAARLVEYMNDAIYQTVGCSVLAISPSRSDVVVISDDPDFPKTAEIAQQNGLFDVGLTSPLYAATRPQHFPVLQKVLNLEVTPEEGIRDYERRLNAVLE